MTDDENVRQVRDSEAATASEPDADSPSLESEVSQLERRWQDLTKANQRELMSLAQMGAALDPGFLNRMRLDMFIAFIFTRMGNVPEEVRKLLTWQFEVEFEATVAERLKDAKSEVRKAMLTQGIGNNIPEGQLQKLWQEQQKGNGGSSPFSRG
jgi:hypothetical protein